MVCVMLIACKLIHFTALELGHLILEISEHIDTEKAIHRFVRAFLAPRPAVEFELGTKRHAISLYELHLLKHKYGLCMQAWIERAKDLQILSEKDATQLVKLFRQRHWYYDEPGDALPPEEPQRFKRLVMNAFCEGIISQARAAELLGVDLLQFLGEEEERHGGLPIEWYPLGFRRNGADKDNSAVSSNRCTECNARKGESIPTR
jgi:hypothetical protein